MTFGEKMKEMLNQGAVFTRELVEKAGNKAQDLGEKGVLKFEIHQLEVQAQKKLANLGNELYTLLEEKGSKTVSRNTPGVRELIDELIQIKNSIDTRQKELEEGKKN